MSNENAAMFDAFIAKCSSVYVVAGTFGQTDVEFSVQRHNDNKLQISLGGLTPSSAIAVFDSLGIHIDDSTIKEGPKKRRRRKVEKEAEKLAAEDATVEDEPTSVADPPKQRRKRRTQEEIAADEAAAQADPPKQRRKRRTQEEIAADKEAEQTAKEPAKRRRRRRQQEPPPPPPQEEEDAFHLNDSQLEVVGAAAVADDVIEVIFDALPADVDDAQCVAAIISVKDAGVAPALKGWTKAQIEEIVAQFV